MLVYNNKINKNTKWSGDKSTFGFPVSGDRVEEFIKESLQKKAGYIYLEGNNLLVFADEVDYETYSLDHSKRDLIIQWISIYNHIAYANKDSLGNIIDFSTSVSEGKDYFGICINSSENNPENPSEYNWVYIKGTPGKDGRDGIDGLNGRDGTNGINGQDGITPTINPTTNHWMIGEVDTEVLAIGKTPHINSSTKRWMVGEEDTGILAEGTKGERGLNAPYLVITYGKSSYSLTNSFTGPSDITTWTQDIPQRTIGTFIWMRIQNYSGEGLLQNTQYTCITGDTGLKGKWYEYAGVWSIDDIQSVTNSTSIGYYVKYGNKFYMNIAPDNEVNNTVPGPNNPKWEEMPADRQFYIAKAFFGDYAEFGSGIINGDWMISKIGISDSPSNNPHDFDSDSPNTINMNEDNFIPQYTLNMKTGKVYLNDAELRGKIFANEGSIGGWEIVNHNLRSSIYNPETSQTGTITISSESGSIDVHNVITDGLHSIQNDFNISSIYNDSSNTLLGGIFINNQYQDHSGTEYRRGYFCNKGIQFSKGPTNWASSSMGGVVPVQLSIEGSGWLGNAVSWNSNGSGNLASGNISWTSEGDLTIKGNDTDSIISTDEGKFVFHNIEEEAETGVLQLSYDGVRVNSYGPSYSYLTGNGLVVDGGNIDVIGGIIRLYPDNNSNELINIDSNDGIIEASSFKKTGGTSSLVLMANGSAKTGYTGNVNLGTHTLVIEGGIITNVTQNNN